MKYLFSAAGEAALARVAGGARTLYAFDFDGTLAPIETRPERVRTPMGVLKLLRTLAAIAPVAVISGRRRADLLARLPESVRYLIGNHGNEGGVAAVDAARLAAVCEDWSAQLSAVLADPRGAAGIVLEDKTLSLSLHYRLARNRPRAERWLAEHIAALRPAPRVIGGKLVYNLLPPGAVTKFEALQALAAAEAAEHVLFVGDDDTDEIVFDQAPDSWLTVRVEFARGSRARYFLHQQSGVITLLDALLRHHAPGAGLAGGSRLP